MTEDTAAVFVLRKRCVDHMVPVLYEWLEAYDVPTYLVDTTDSRVLTDYRIQFLRDKDYSQLTIHHVSDIWAGDSAFLQYGVGGLQRLVRLPGTKPLRTAWNRIRTTALFPLYYVSVEEIFDQLVPEVRCGIVVYDWPRDVTHPHGAFMQEIIDEATGRGFSTIAIPHGDKPYRNLLMYNSTLEEYEYDFDGIDIEEIRQEKRNQPTGHDHYVYPNEVSTRKYTPDLPEERIHLLGSARFNPEWVDIHADLVPNYEPPKSKGKTRLLLFLTKPKFPVFWQEVERTVRLIANMDDVYLAIKAHTRVDDFEALAGMSNRDNVDFLTNEVPSTAVLNWSDAVLSLGTSITYEAIVRDLPVLSLEYLHANHTTVADTLPGCIMHCREDVYRAIDAVRNDDDRTYSPDERERFMREVVEGGHESVLSEYTSLLYRCLVDPTMSGRTTV